MSLEFVKMALLYQVLLKVFIVSIGAMDQEISIFLAHVCVLFMS